MYICNSTAQAGGGSFKNTKPIGEVGCCELRVTDGRAKTLMDCQVVGVSPLSLSLSLSFSLVLSLSFSFSDYIHTYLPTYLSVYLSTYLPVCLSVYLSIHLSI